MFFHQSLCSKYCHWTFLIKSIEYLSLKLFQNLVQFLNALKISRSSNWPKSNVVQNFVFVRLFSISKIVYPQFKQTNKQTNKKTNKNLQKYSYCLIFAWVKTYVNIMRFARLVACQNEECFSENYWTSFLAL